MRWKLRAFGAHAYAVGTDIVFGEARYAPGSSDGQRLLAHELTHVVQQAQGGPGDPDRASDRADASEREADALADRAAGDPVRVQAAPQAAIARDEQEGGWFSSLASSAWGGTRAAAGAVYDNYEKAKDFKALQSGIKDPKTAEQVKGHWYESLVTGGMNGGIDALEKGAAAGNQEMVDDSKGHWYEGLAKADAWMNNGMTQATGGLVKGVGDLGFGLVNGIAHPIDAVAGLEGIAEHDLPMVGSVLKAGHGIYDLAANGGGQYGNSAGEMANHIFNPMQQMEDDRKFNTNLAAGILAPDEVGKKDANGRPVDGGQAIVNAFKDKPVEATTRAITNIIPFFLGGGETDAAKAADVGDIAEVTEGGAGQTASGRRGRFRSGRAGTAGQPGPQRRRFRAAEGGPVTTGDHGGRAEGQRPQRRIRRCAQHSGYGAGAGPEPRWHPPNERRRYAQDEHEKGGRRPKYGRGSRRGSQRPVYEQDRIAQDGRVFPLENGGKITQMPGGVGESKGTGYREGIMEYIVDKEGDLVHQQFRQGGGVNGEFGGKPEVRPNNGSYYPDDL